MNIVVKRSVVHVTLAVSLAYVCQATFAQSFTKPVRFITQFAAGVSGDVSLRLISPHLSNEFGQPVVIENRPGAGGELAAQLVTQSIPDGYTILHANSTSQIIRPYLVKGAALDPVKGFTAISMMYVPVYVIVANQSAPISNPRELIDYAKQYPGKLSYGTSGLGTDHHLNALQIQQLAGIDMVHVPYKSTGQAQIDVISGQLPMTFTTLGNAIPVLKSGKVKAIAVVSSKRNSLLPGVQSIGDVLPAYQPIPTWVGIFGPAGVPAPIASRLRSAFVKSLHQPDAIARWAEYGYELIDSSPEEFGRLVKQQYDLVGRIVKTAGIASE